MAGINLRLPDAHGDCDRKKASAEMLNDRIKASIWRISAIRPEAIYSNEWSQEHEYPETAEYILC